MRRLTPRIVLFFTVALLFVSANSCGRKPTPRELARQSDIKIKLAKVKNFSQAVQLYCEGIDISKYNLKCTNLNIPDYQSDSRQPILDVMIKMAKSFSDWLMVWFYAPADCQGRQYAYVKMFETANAFEDWHALSFEADGRDRQTILKNMFAKARSYEEWEINLGLFNEKAQDVLIKMSKFAKTRPQWKKICEDPRARSDMKRRACENAKIKNPK